MYNILIGGAAGDGIETTALVLEKTLKRMGYHVFAIRDFMSRVRGGHNFVQIAFGSQPVATHCDKLDGIVAINEESFHLHKDKLKEDGFILCEPDIKIEHDNVITLPLTKIATEAGNKRAAGSVVIGAILSLFDLDLKGGQDVFKDHFPEKILQANLLSLEGGYNYVTAQFDLEPPTDLSKHLLINGAQAMSAGALAGNMRVYAAYPMSPASSLLSFFSSVEKEAELVVEQVEDEIAAINMAIGASAAGARAMTGTSGGGFSLMVEALGFAGIAEVPLVVVDVQRPGPATGLPTRTEQSDLMFVAHASQGEFPRLVISPQDHKNLYHHTRRAFDIAEKYQMPVILLSDQYLADSTSVVPLDEMSNQEGYEVKDLLQNVSPQVDDNGVYKRYQYTDTGISPLYHYGETDYLVRVDSDEHTEYGVITESAEVRKNMVDKRAKKLELLEEDLIQPIFVGDINPEFLVLGFGSTYAAIKKAVENLNSNGGKFAALCFSDVYPLPTRELMHYGEIASKVVSVEQNATGQFAGLVRQTTLLDCKPAFLKYDGRQMSWLEISDALKKLGKDGN